MTKIYTSITSLLHSDLKIRVWQNQTAEFDQDDARISAKRIVMNSLEYGKGAKTLTQIANQLLDASPFFIKVEVTDYTGNGTIIHKEIPSL